MKHIYLKSLSCLPKMFLDYFTTHKVDSIIDFGCGYGFWFNVLLQNNMLPHTAVGIDFDKSLCEYAVEHVPEIRVVYGDASKISFKKPYFNLAVCNQVIEHTIDDIAVINNIKSALFDGGVLYISSIIRKPWAWYPYKYEGEVRLSPMHVKEYKSLYEFNKLLTDAGFTIMESHSKQYWLRSWSIPGLRGKIAVPVPGFHRCEALVRK